MAEFSLQKYLDEMNKLYQIGEVVAVIDRGLVYSTYNRMFTKLGFKNTDQNKTPVRCEERMWKIFTPVINHEDSNECNPILLVGIESGADQLLIGINGLGSYVNKYDELKKLELSPEQIFGVLSFVEKYYKLK